jgi:hypothetical protein
MCYQTITTFRECGHSDRSFHRCKASFERTKQINRVGFFKKLFCMSTAKSDCKPSTCHSNLIGFCEGCIENQQQEKRQRYAAARQAHNQNEGFRRAERKRSERKRAFRCSKCTKENRRVANPEREANGGLCCARGLEEWAARERAQGTFRKLVPLPQVSEYIPYTYTDLENGFPLPSVRRPDPELTRAREAATVAARGYGWTRDHPQSDQSHDPRLVRDFLSISGTDRRSLSPPPPEPRYEEPGINWEMWNQFPRTHHGRYPPPPAPAPPGPLPILPLRTPGTSRTSRSLTTRRRQEKPESRKIVSLTSSSPVELPSAPVSPLSNPRFSEKLYPQPLRLESRKIVSPMSSSPVEPPSPVSSLSNSRFPENLYPQPLGSPVSHLDIELAAALNYWGGEHEEDRSDSHIGFRHREV